MSKSALYERFGSGPYVPETSPKIEKTKGK